MSQFPTFAQVAQAARSASRTPVPTLDGVPVKASWTARQIEGHPLARRLGGGAQRAGYRLDPGFVAKLAHNDDSLSRNREANRREVVIWKSASPVQRAFLATPYLWSRDFDWVIFEEVECGRRWDSDDEHLKHDHMTELGEALGVNDIHGGNVGYRSGTDQMVLTDYSGYAWWNGMCRDDI